VHQALVVENRDAGNGYFRIVLRALALAGPAKPGHFVMLRVSENLDPILARPFGIAAVRPRSDIELYYRVVGRGTTLLTTVRKGASLAVHGPLGNGFPAPAKGETPLLVAGGSGFPPLLFFASRHGKRARFFAGSRDKACLPPAAAMRAFRSTVAALHYATEDGSCGTCGFVTDALASYLDHPSSGRPVIYACGPHAMLAAVSRLAAERGITCFVSLEERMACGLGVCMGCSIPVAAGGYRRACTEGPVFDSREIAWNGPVPLAIMNAEQGVRNEK
jgi:dihydroorotate dehydrogenase electron transfer subunit